MPKRRGTREPIPRTGIPVDASGGPAFDPTRNVMDMVNASVRRLDDLATAQAVRVDEKLDLRTAYFDRLLENNERHTEELADLRTKHQAELMAAEAKRIDAIRVIDIQAVNTATEKATAQAQVLANQVASSAETLRTLVATSAAATAAQLSSIITPITDRIALLEKSQYEGAGRGAARDPMLDTLLAEMKATRDQIAMGVGRGGGLANGYGLAVGAVGMLITLVTIGFKIFG